MFMAGTFMGWGARKWIKIGYGNDMFINPSIMRMMEMPIMQKISMVFMCNSLMATARAMGMVMPTMNFVRNHSDFVVLQGNGFFPC